MELELHQQTRHRDRSTEDRPHRGSGERYDNHDHHNVDNIFVVGEKLLHGTRSPVPAAIRASEGERERRTDR
ncbi:hypothetical protein ACNJ7E_12080 [Rhodococcus sp. NM-2]|uniref:hypothetical protein n=1 Tax=Rhodococcus TaxID=1827 RepID=UPI002476CBAF|nr:MULTISPECIES: hypothetical protein [Rhodococcus]MDH6291768.1 hypothetical protein [Rhodococcus opacus]MDI9953245.1 hypothetical protein [Rhodococcus sp. IEGM 1305]MDI9973849.1 hypothetical protein [Rhodococcus sp. IEGM 1307]